MGDKRSISGDRVRLRAYVSESGDEFLGVRVDGRWRDVVVDRLLPGARDQQSRSLRTSRQHQ